MSCFGSLTIVIAVVLLSSPPTYGYVKRSAEDQWYVFSKRACVALKSNDVCPVTWKVPAYYAAPYKFGVKGVKSILDLGLPKNCTDILTSVICSASTPRCQEDDSIDFGDVASTCQKMLEVCPKHVADAYREVKYCDNFITGKYDGKCISGTTTGSCPQPKYKMPPDILEAYQKVSNGIDKSISLLRKLKYTNGSKAFSSDCVTKYKDMACTPMYCSDDGKRVLVKHNKEQCLKVTDGCFIKMLDDLPADAQQVANVVRDMIASTCSNYPSANSTETEALTGKDTNSKEYYCVSKSLFASLLLFLFAKYVAM